ncbi:MAG: class I SAM-dependent methyltransferase [Alphaproteobacteria bacterium]
MHCIICDGRMRQRLSWVWHCAACGFWRSELVAGAGRGVDGLELLRRDNFASLCDRLERGLRLTRKSCLEVGCAEGWFLDEMRNCGADCLGIEPSNVAQFAIDAGHDVKIGLFPHVLDDRSVFDFIVFNDVFEHLPNLIDALENCERRLKPGGHLVLNLPNSDGFFFRLSLVLLKFGRSSAFDRLWQKDFPSPHLSYFNPGNLTALVDRYTGLNAVESFALPSIRHEGLKDRIATSHKGVMGYLLYLGLSAGLPIFKHLPSDICVLVFQKPAGEDLR